MSQFKNRSSPSLADLAGAAEGVTPISCVPFLLADIILPIKRQQNRYRVLSSTSAVQTGVTSVAINFHISTLGCELQKLRSEQTHRLSSLLCYCCG